MKVLAIAGGIVALSVCGYALFLTPVSKTVTFVDAVAFTGPVSPTVTQVAAFTQARALGTALPLGWTITQMEGKVTVTDTGVVKVGTNERLWKVTVKDDPTDLATATVYINSVAVYTATRANGGIVDRSGMSLATASVYVPPSGTSFNAKVEWVANDSSVRECDGLVP